MRESYIGLLKYSTIKINAQKFIGFTVAFDFLLALAAAFYLGLAIEGYFWFSFVGLFFIGQIFIYFWLVLRADTKARFVEGILPDVLHLMSSNLRAGLTTDKALLLSARPEFGPFQDEINQIGKEVTMGKDISRALMDMVQHIKSDRLSKTMELIVSGLSSGGELASLLEQTAKNLRRERLVDSRIRANVMMYVIFIFVAVCFGAPLLFGLSSFLVEVLTNVLSSVELPEATSVNLAISFTEVSISIDFVRKFSVVFLITSSVLGSLILGLISKGKERDGIKYIPFLMGLSVAMYYFVTFCIKTLLGGMFEF